MAGAGSRVGERAPCDGHEAPVVGGGVQRKFQDTECVAAAGLRCREDGRESPQTASAGADHELPHAARRVSGAARVLRCKPFVIVFVTVEDDVDATVVCVLEEGPAAWGFATRGKVGLVPKRNGACVAMSSEVVAKPHILRRASAVGNLTVQYHDVPGA